jgi:hypothetical protein
MGGVAQWDGTSGGVPVWKASTVGLLAPESRVDTRGSSTGYAALALGFALLALNILDLLLTNLSITRFGGTEVNPLMMPIVGTPWAVLAKVGIPILVMALALRVRSPRTIRFLRFAVAVYVLVAVLTLGQVALVLL